MSRPLPWTDLVAAIGEEHFAAIKASLEAEKTDPFVRDAFLLNRAVAAVFRDLMPEDAPAEAINAYGALLHMLYLGWSHDWPMTTVSGEHVKAETKSPQPLAHSPTRLPAYSYVQLPERLVWAQADTEEPHEPVDGIFAVLMPHSAHALAILGFRSEREGFTTMEGAITLPAAAPQPRDDGSAPFASRLAGGKDLISIVDEHELVALALYTVNRV